MNCNFKLITRGEYLYAALYFEKNILSNTNVKKNKMYYIISVSGIKGNTRKTKIINIDGKQWNIYLINTDIHSNVYYTKYTALGLIATS